MPIYEYKCGSCGHLFEAIQKMSDPVLKDCPSCGQSELKKLMSAAGFQLKGSGWYATDFKGGGQKKQDGQTKEKPSDATDTVPPKKNAGGSCGGGSCGCAH